MTLWGYGRVLEGNCEGRGGRVGTRFKRGCRGQSKGIEGGSGGGLRGRVWPHG